MTTNSFETLFAVPMHCSACVKSVTEELQTIQGVTKVDADLEKQTVRIIGTAPPSKIVAAIEAAGRVAILRGSGGSNSAAVSILETYHASPAVIDPSREVRGLARMVEVADGTTLIDLTIRGVSPGKYHATIRATGNLEDGVSTTGSVWSEPSRARGDLGSLVVGKDGRGSAFLESKLHVWEIIGRAFAVTKQRELDGKRLQNDQDTVVGVIARSAGVWDNDKTVCSCTGKTLWEERKDEVEKGML